MNDVIAKCVRFLQLWIVVWGFPFPEGSPKRTHNQAQPLQQINALWNVWAPICQVVPRRPEHAPRWQPRSIALCEFMRGKRNEYILQAEKDKESDARVEASSMWNQKAAVRKNELQQDA